MISLTPTFKGYRIVRPDGSVWSYGDAQYHGGLNPGAPVAGGAMVPGDFATGITNSADGYIITTNKGYSYAFGDAPFFGTPGF